MVAFYNVARRRTFLDRPHTHLRAAARAFAEHVAATPDTDKEAAPEDEPIEPSGHSKAASRQRRGEGGKFA